MAVVEAEGPSWRAKKAGTVRSIVFVLQLSSFAS